DRVPPLATSEMRFGVEERTRPTGEIERGPSANDLQTLASAVAANKPEAIAISLLFSFANPGNESAVAEALSALKVPLSISSELLPEFREYERASTVLLNAYLQPV